MRIAYLVNTYPRASHTFIRREIQALERMGLAVHRFAMRSDRAALHDAKDLEEDRRTEHLLERSKVQLVVSALGWLTRHPAQAAAALRLALRCGGRGNARALHLVYLLEAAHLARRCRDLGVTHLHAHFGTNSATVAMLASVMGGPRYSFTVHGPEEFDAPAALCLGDKVGRAVFVVAVSSFGRSQLCRWADVADWAKLHVVHCGIEPARFPAPDPLPDGVQLVAIGRMAEQKGLPLLVEAMALAAPALPGVRLALVGDGPLRPMIEARIAALGLQDRIRLTGWLDEAAVRAELSAATALVLPSFAEGLPMVVMEAMAAGRPVIATAIAGLPELMTRDTGWLVPAGDAPALADAIITLAAMPRARLAEMGTAGRARVLARHDADTEARRLFSLIEAAHD